MGIRVISGCVYSTRVAVHSHCLPEFVRIVCFCFSGIDEYGGVFLLANILLSEECVSDMYLLVILLDGIEDPDLEKLRSRIEKEIESKIEARRRRESFTKYKSSELGSAARENAR